MSVKNQTDWPIGNLKKWAKPALGYPELIDIARTAMSNTEAKDKALEFTKEQGLDEKVAMACRWLKILRAKLTEEDFEKYSAENKPKKEKRTMGKKDDARKVILLDGVWPPEFIWDPGACGFLRFIDDNSFLEVLNAFLDEVIEDKDCLKRPVMKGFNEETRDKMIQILEEKFKVPIKICYTCKHCLIGEHHDYEPFKITQAACYKNESKVKGIANGFNPPCKTQSWALKEKEVSESKVAGYCCKMPSCNGKKLKKIGPWHYECPAGHRYMEIDGVLQSDTALPCI